MELIPITIFMMLLIPIAIALLVIIVVVLLVKKISDDSARSKGISGKKFLYRSEHNKMLGGVCGGISEYFNIDPTIVRLIWVIVALAFGSGILAYIAAWIIIPDYRNIMY